MSLTKKDVRPTYKSREADLQRTGGIEISLNLSSARGIVP